MSRGKMEETNACVTFSFFLFFSFLAFYQLVVMGTTFWLLVRDT